MLVVGLVVVLVVVVVVVVVVPMMNTASVTLKKVETHLGSATETEQHRRLDIFDDFF